MNRCAVDSLPQRLPTATLPAVPRPLLLERSPLWLPSPFATAYYFSESLSSACSVDIPSRSAPCSSIESTPTANRPKTLLPVSTAPLFVGRHEPENLVVFPCRSDYLVDRTYILRVVELGRNSEKVGQIEVSQPQYVNTRNGRDLVDVSNALFCFNQTDDQACVRSRCGFSRRRHRPHNRRPQNRTPHRADRLEGNGCMTR